MEAGLDRFVAYDKDADFIGKEAAIEEKDSGGKLRLKTFVVDAKDADVIFSEGGIIDKYLGDGILAFFENEGDSISSPIKATHASIKLQREASKLNELYKSQNRFPFIIRIGMATGYAKVGNIGPPEKIDYTIIGSVVNLASRLQGFGTDKEITIDKDTHFFIKDEYKTKSCGENNLKGFDSPQEIFKIEYDK